MKIAYKIACFFLFAVFFTACKKDDGGTSYTPPRPYAEVYPEDLAKIEDYLQNHYVTYNEVDNGDGTKDITNVVIGKIDTGTPQTPIKDHPLLTFMTVKLHGLEYKVYYLNLFQGYPEDPAVYNNGGKTPCAVDKILTTYKGMLLDDTVFDQRPNSVNINLYETILGWQYIFPKFRSGKNTLNSEGVLTHKAYGAGVVFLPSGLGYYERAVGDITAYSPLVFIFNLNNVTHLDTDLDGVESHFEFNYNADGTLQDTDGDGIPDYRDIDDDNDGYLTKDEITHTVTIKNNNGVVQSVNRYVYPFNGAAANDPATIYVDDTQGIPDCSGDYATPTRKRRHLDKNCFTTINLDIIQ
ncbi:hypothetical protein LZZ90_02900 [Flavobacterium sp. SM15]|uniref:FKBP-type peptidyl-prolyl cis-trans isomerase n=1 Tax=Flavobacterium sp. SM15 TaxID=2908005 RepID=UPI001EDA3AA6|nr:hypothetical protein [Flavobacterium sp. SM15]MCG2610455.1 hypothetical protein [Flavobacterium sp. SM15]